VTRLVAISNDPISAYLAKGEIKAGYFNPGDLFDQVDIITLTDRDVSPEEVLALAGRAKLNIHPVGRVSPANLARLFPRVRRLIARLKPDIIRAHNPWLGGALAVHAGRAIGRPALVYLHIENDQRRRFDKRFRFRLVKPLERYSLSRADLVVCVSKFLEGYARRYGASKVTTVYNKVYTDQFARPAPEDLRRPLQILYVGRLDPQKCPELIIQAMEGLDAELTLIGQGSERARLEDLAKRLGLGPRVRFIDSVPNAEIQRHYHQADIFAMATHYEGFCIPVLEAMACGLPVVACDTQPIPEILGETGLVVAKSASAYQETFKLLQATPKLALDLGRRAAERAGGLDGRLMEEQEAAIYRQLLAD